MKKYDFVSNYNINGLTPVKLNNKYGFINENYDEICEIKYDSVWHFHNGFAIVQLNHKFGFINEQGEEICEIKYEYIELYYILNQYIKNKERNLKLIFII
jgi:hypothetical protein